LKTDISSFFPICKPKTRKSFLYSITFSGLPLQVGVSFFSSNCGGKKGD
jgi:hypothetical protein